MVLNKLKLFWYNFFQFPKYILFHPFDGYEEFQRYKKARFSVATIFIFLYVILRIVQFSYNGPLVNHNDPQNLDSLKELFGVVVIVGVFVIANWSTTTLMEGKGSLKEIYMMVGYSLWPIILIGFPNVIFSNFITADEVAFHTLFDVLGYIATGWMLFTGLISIHQYGLGKTLVSILFTVVVMVIIIFIGLLFFDIIQQVINFIAQIFQEIRLR